MLRSTGADARCHFRRRGRDQSAGRAPALGRPRRRRTRSARRSRSSSARAIRDGALRPGAQVPSTRDLARQLGISRRVAVEAYAQLAAEGYLSLRQGARPRVSRDRGRRARAAHARRSRPPRRRRASTSARACPTSRPSRAPPGCGRCARRSATMTDADLGYGDPSGDDALRAALADYLGRVRGVVADPAPRRRHQRLHAGPGRSSATRSRRAGAKRIALEDPSNPEQREIARARRARAGAGRRSTTTASGSTSSRAPSTPSSSPPPTSTRPASCSPPSAAPRCSQWLREHDALAIEDDYDAEYRYDRAAVGALQGLEPDRVVYAGSASKTLAPALRLGWLVVPPRLVERDPRGEATSPTWARPGSSSTRSRTSSRAASSTATCAACAPATARAATRSSRRSPSALPEATVQGIAAGLHVTVRAARAATTSAAIARGGRAPAHRASTRCATTATTTAPARRR